MSESTPVAKDALVAASPFRLARRAGRAMSGLPWGGVRRKYRESDWIRDRLGRWMKFVGIKKAQDNWDTDATGRERPNFAHGNVYDSRIGRTPRYKNRIASPQLDDGSVVMEVGNSIQDLGRVDDPDESTWADLPTELPDRLLPGESAFVRRNPDTMELVSDPAAKMGGRALLEREGRQRRGALEAQSRAAIGERAPVARIGEEIVEEGDALGVPDFDEEGDALDLGKPLTQREMSRLENIEDGYNGTTDPVRREKLLAEHRRLRRKELNQFDPRWAEEEERIYSPERRDQLRAQIPDWDEMLFEDQRAELQDYDQRLQREAYEASLPQPYNFDAEDDPRIRRDIYDYDSKLEYLDALNRESTAVTDPVEKDKIFDRFDRVEKMEFKGYDTLTRTGGQETKYSPERRALARSMDTRWDERSIEEQRNVLDILDEDLTPGIDEAGMREAVERGISFAEHESDLGRQIEDEDRLEEERLQQRAREFNPDWDALDEPERFYRAEVLRSVQDENPAAKGKRLRRLYDQEMSRLNDVFGSEGEGDALDLGDDPGIRRLQEIRNEYKTADRARRDELFEEYERVNQEVMANRPWGGPSPEVQEEIARVNSPERRELARALDDRWDQRSLRDQQHLLQNLDMDLRENPDMDDSAMAAAWEENEQDLGWTRQEEQEVAEINAARAPERLDMARSLEPGWDSLDEYEQESRLWALNDVLDDNPGATADEIPELYRNYREGRRVQDAEAEALTRSIFGTPEGAPLAYDNDAAAGAMESLLGHNNALERELLALPDEMLDGEIGNEIDDQLGGIENVADALSRFVDTPTREALEGLRSAVNYNSDIDDPAFREAVAPLNSFIEGVDKANLGSGWGESDSPGAPSVDTLPADLLDPEERRDAGSKVLDEIAHGGILGPEDQLGEGGTLDPAEFPGIDAAKNAALDAGWTIDPNDPGSLVSPDGRYSLEPLPTLFGQPMDSVVMQDLSDGSIAMHDVDDPEPVGDWLSRMSSGLGGSEGGDALDLGGPVGEGDLGAPVPVGRYRPGANVRDQPGGHRRGWVTRPYGMREADYRERDRRQAIEESMAEGGDALDIGNKELDSLRSESVALRSQINDLAASVPQGEQVPDEVRNQLRDLRAQRQEVDGHIFQAKQAKRQEPLPDPDAAVDDLLQKAEAAGLPEEMLHRIETAESGNEIVDLFDEVDGDALNISEADRRALREAVIRAGRLDQLAPRGPVSTTEDEVADSAARAAESGRLADAPMYDQMKAIIDLMVANEHLLKDTDRRWMNKEIAVPGKKGQKKRRRDLYLDIAAAMDAGDLDERQLQSLYNKISWMPEGVFKESYLKEFPTEEKDILYNDLINRAQIMKQAAQSRSGMEVSERHEAQQEVIRQREQKIQQLLQTQPRPPGSWMYGNDIAANPDYNSSSGQKALLQSIDKQMGGIQGRYVNPFSTDDDMERNWRALMDDISDFQDLMTNPESNTLSREQMLSRVISRAGFFAGTGLVPELEQLRDDLVAYRQAAHGQTGSTGWDLSDDMIKDIKHALQPYVGKGTSEGRDYGSVSKALGDALTFDPGHPGRYAALNRARYLMHANYGRQTIPMMNAMGIPLPVKRQPKDLVDPNFELIEDNLGPIRDEPRGGKEWSEGDLRQLRSVAAGLRQSVAGATGPMADNRRRAAGLLEQAIKAYRAEDYGAFEAITEMALSRLMQIGDKDALADVANLRDAHWGDTDWDKKVGDLKSDLIDKYGELPVDGGIISQGQLRNRPDALRMRQNAMNLVAEGIARPVGSVDQRVKLASALWFLRQANDPDDAELINMLAAWDPNHDVNFARMEPKRRKVRKGPAADARIARAQGVMNEIVTGGPMSRKQMQRAFGMTEDQVRRLMERLESLGLLTKTKATADLAPERQMFDIGPALFRAIPGRYGSRRPLTSAEIDHAILQALAGALKKPSAVRGSAGPYGFFFLDPRIAVEGDGSSFASGDLKIGLVGSVPGLMHPNAAAWWDPGFGGWKLSTFAVGDWKTFGDEPDETGVETRLFPTLRGLRTALIELADINNLPYPPKPMVASFPPDAKIIIVGEPPSEAGYDIEYDDDGQIIEEPELPDAVEDVIEEIFPAGVSPDVEDVLEGEFPEPYGESLPLEDIAIDVESPVEEILPVEEDILPEEDILVIPIVQPVGRHGPPGVVVPIDDEAVR